jgi:hypothetical protein
MSWAWSATYASTRASDRILNSQALAMTELQLTVWRRHVFRLYATVRDQDHPAGAHQLGREGRDALFREHPRSLCRPRIPSGRPGFRAGPTILSRDFSCRSPARVTRLSCRCRPGATARRCCGVSGLYNSRLRWTRRLACGGWISTPAACFSRCVMARPVRAATVEAVICLTPPRAPTSAPTSQP